MNDVAARAEILLGLEREVGVLIRRVRRLLWERSHEVHADLQPASYLLLAHLTQHGASRASVVAEVLGIDKGAISRQVQHLLELGLVDRSPDPQDGRATLVSATDDAVRRMNDVAERRRRTLDEQLGEWSEEDLVSFVGVLGSYNAALG